MDGDKPDKSRRGFIWAGVGTVVGIAASQLYEMTARLDERLPSVIRERYRVDILPYLDQIKACENRVNEIQSKLSKFQNDLSNTGLLETEYNTELKKAYEDLDDSITGTENVVNKYKPILGSDALLVEDTTLDLLKKHRIERSQHQEQISQLNSQITTLNDRIEGLEGEIEIAKSYLQNDFVTVSGTEFVLKGTPYVPCGFNYDPRDHSWMMFEDWDPKEIKDELKLGKSLNANSIRIFINWQSTEQTSKRDPYVKKVREFLDIADSLGYNTILTLFDQPTVEMYTNIDLVKEYLKDIIPKFSQDPRILAWDLKNAPLSDYLWPDLSRDVVLEFLRNVSDIVRSLDINHPITVGGLCPVDLGELSIWRGQYEPDLKDKLDFISVGFYDIPDHLISAIPKIKNETRKPVILVEFGLHTWADTPEDPHTENDQKTFYEEVMDISFKDKVSGLLFWTLMDFPIGSIPGHPEEFFENHMGVFRTDYSPKPAVSPIREFYKKFLTSIYE